MGEDRPGEPQANQERLTVAQAATALGITEGAVRSRIKRGTLRTTKEGGTVFVLLGGGTAQANQTTNTSDQSALIGALRDQIEDLRRERDEWREQSRITDRLLSAAMERIPPQLEAPPEARESPESSGPAGGPGEVWEELDTERARREMAETTMHEGMDEERRRREEAERERDELRRELYGLREVPEAPDTAREAPDRAESRPANGGAQEGVQRPWWRRVLGR